MAEANICTFVIDRFINGPLEVITDEGDSLTSPEEAPKNKNGCDQSSNSLSAKFYAELGQEFDEKRKIGEVKSLTNALKFCITASNKGTLFVSYHGNGLIYD